MLSLNTRHASGLARVERAKPAETRMPIGLTSKA
jgi:hypothetical protein